MRRQQKLYLAEERRSLRKGKHDMDHERTFMRKRIRRARWNDLRNKLKQLLLHPFQMKSEIEIGMEGRLFNNSITFDVNYYDNTSTDQIFAVPVAASSGYTSKLMNAGSIKNSGIEIQLGGRGNIVRGQ